MGKLFKWLFGLIILLVILVVAAAVILPMVVDPNDYKPQIETAVKEKLGRDLAIEQDLGLSVFPWLGIETGGVTLGNAPGFSADAFAKIEEVGVKVKLMPLLSREVEVDTLVLKGLQVNLEKDENGKTNWDDLAGEGKAEAPSAPKEEGPAGAEDGAAGVSLKVQGVQIEDARISWDDRQAGETYVLDGVRLVTGSLAPGAKVPVEAGVTITSTKPAMTLDAALNATVGTDSDLKVFDIAGLVLALDAQGEGLPAGGAKLEIKGDINADTNADTLKVSGLAVTGPAMSATGEFGVASMQTVPAVTGRLAIAETNLKTLASMFAAPIETTDPKAMTRASGDLAFSFQDGVLKLDPLTLRLDDSKLSGHVHLLDGKGPVVRTALTLDDIDLDRYAPPAKASSGEQAEGESKQADGKEAGAVEDPFAALRTLDFVGDFKIGKLKVGNARMSNVATKIVSRNGVLKVDPMGADLYQGNFKGSVILDAKEKDPKIAAKKALNGIQIGPLLKDVAGQDRLLGQGDLKLDVKMVGLNEAQIRRSLNGTSRFSFRDGALKGVNIAEVIRKGGAALGLGGDGETGTPGQTDFSEMSGSVTMTNGVIKNRDLQAKSPLLRIEGKGEVDLPRDTIDYLVITELVGSLQGQGGRNRGELAGIPIPVRVSGPLAEPGFKPDLEAALSAKAKAQLEEKKKEVRKKVEDKVKDKVGGALKGLFN